MPVFGNRPDDVMQDKAGNAQSGVSIVLYATQSDAQTQVSPLGTATTDSNGRWPITLSGNQVWARDPAGNVWAVASEDAISTQDARLTTAEANISSNTTAISGKVSKGSLYVNVKDNGAVGDGSTDDTAAINTVLAAGGDVYLPAGTYKVSTLTVSSAGTRLRFAKGASLVKTGSVSDTYVSGGTSGPAFSDCLRITGADVTVDGLAVTSPAVWDGTNDGVTGRDAAAVVRITGHRATLNNPVLTNVPKYGIAVVDVDDAQIVNPRIYGNFPVGSYTGTNTGHAGIHLDPSSTANGSGQVSGGTITGCVQGVLLGNLGAGVGYGYRVTGVAFRDCHNHGVYGSVGVNSTIVSGCSFVHCQIPVVATGQGHAIIGNTIFTPSTGGNDDATGISLRDPADCIIQGNTIIGDLTSSAIGIDVACLSGTSITNVIVEGNVLNLAGTGNPAIRAGSGANTMTGVQIRGNVVKGAGLASNGLIKVLMAVSQIGQGLLVEGNTVICTGNTHGIQIAQQKAAMIRGNTIRNEYSAGSVTTLIHLFLTTVTVSVVKDTTSFNLSGTGTNCTLQAIREDNTSSGNTIEPPKVLHESGYSGTAPLLIQGSIPTAAAGANAGTSPPAPVIGTNALNHRGNVTFGTGTTPAAGAMAVVSFTGTQFTLAPFVTVVARNAATAALGLYVSATATGSFTVSCTTAPAASQANTTYSFDFVAAA